MTGYHASVSPSARAARKTRRCPWDSALIASHRTRPDSSHPAAGSTSFYRSNGYELAWTTAVTSKASLSTSGLWHHGNQLRHAAAVSVMHKRSAVHTSIYRCTCIPSLTAKSVADTCESYKPVIVITRVMPALQSLPQRRSLLDTWTASYSTYVVIGTLSTQADMRGMNSSREIILQLYMY